MSLAPGARLGPYEISAAIGSGGMGEVYRARDSKLSRDVAIKIMPASVAGDPDRLERFEREAQAVASLSHPNIVAIFEFGAHEGQPFVVMELLEGETLREVVVDIATGKRRVIPVALGCRVNSESFAVAPDGKTLFFGAQRVEANVWKVTRPR